MDNGGPAFPGTHQYFPDDVNYDEFHGMTLRDYFAGQALAGFAADPEASWQDGGGLPSMARCAYQWADAMLKAREVKP